MAYKGPVARMREEMERERAAFALSGQALEVPDNCPIIAHILRAGLLTPWSGTIVGGRSRPWRLGTDMVGPVWAWTGLGRIVNDPENDGLVQVWTRKAHRAWRFDRLTIRCVAGRILEGEIRDAFR